MKAAAFKYAAAFTSVQQFDITQHSKMYMVLVLLGVLATTLAATTTPGRKINQAFHTS